MEGMTGTLTAWLSDHSQWLGLAIFLIAMVESLAIAGLLVPGVVLLVAVTAMAGSGDMALMTAMSWAFAGAVCGDMLSFTLGRVFHQDIKRLGIFRRHPQWIGRGEGFFRRYGMLSVVIGRFVGPIRPVIPLVAGMFDMPVWRFTLVNVASALAWAPIYVVPGYTAGHALHWAVPPFFWTQALILLGALGALALGITLILRQQERWSALAAGALALVCLPVLILTRPLFAVFDGAATGWLHGFASSLPPAVGPLLAIFDQPFYLLLLAAAPALILATARSWRHLAFIALAMLTCSGLAVLSGELQLGLNLALVLTAFMAITTLCNREQGFWRRVAWMLYLLPLGCLAIAATLLPPALAIVTVVKATLLAGAATLLSLWLIERAVVIPAVSGPLRFILPAWPLCAAALTGLALVR